MSAQAVVITRAQARKIRDIALEIEFYVERVARRLALKGALKGEVEDSLLIEKAMLVSKRVGLMYHAPRRKLVEHAWRLVDQADNFADFAWSYLDKVRDEKIEKSLRAIFDLSKQLHDLLKSMKEVKGE